MAKNNDRWTALSIQDRIRAMNETLDTVDQQQTTAPILVETVGEESSSNTVEGSSIRETSSRDFSAPQQPKRSSVVDIWRKREGGGGGGGGGVKSATVPNRNTSSSQQQQQPPEESSLNDVKIPLSNKFSKQTIQEPAPREKRSETEEKHRQSRTAKWNQRRLDSATPTPPPLPGSNRASFKKMDNEPADLTILPATSSSTSSININNNGEQSPSSTQSRSSRLANMWGKLNGKVVAEPTKEGGGGSVGDDLSEPAVADQTITTPPTAKRKSVVDIWKNRASPGSLQCATEDTGESSSPVISPSSTTINRKSFDSEGFKTASPDAVWKKPADWTKEDQDMIESSSSVSPAVTNRKSFESDVSKQSSFKPPPPVKTRANVKVPPPTDSSDKTTRRVKRWPQPNQLDEEEAEFAIAPSAQKRSTEISSTASSTASTSFKGSISGKITDRWTQRMSDHHSKASPAKEDLDYVNQSEEINSPVPASPPRSGGKLVGPVPASPPRSGGKLVDRWTPMRHHSIGDTAVEPNKSPSRGKSTSNAKTHIGSRGIVTDRWKAVERSDSASSANSTKEDGTDIKGDKTRSPGRVTERWRDDGDDTGSSLEKMAGEVEQHQKSRPGSKITDIWKNALKGNSFRNVNGEKSPVVSQRVTGQEDNKVAEMQDDGVPLAPPPLVNANDDDDDDDDSSAQQKGVAFPGSVSDNAFPDENISSPTKSSGEAVNSSDAPVRGKITDRWTVAAKEKSAVHQSETIAGDSPREKTRGKVTDRWKYSSDSSLKAGLQENETVSALVREHAVRTPTGQVRSKLSDRWTNRSTTEASLASRMDNVDDKDQSPPTDNGSEKEKASGVVLCNEEVMIQVQKESVQDDEGTEVAGTASQVDDNGISALDASSRRSPGTIDATVSALVKDYAGRTPTGQRRNKVLDRWNKRMSSPNHNDVEEHANGTDPGAIATNFAALDASKNSTGTSGENFPSETSPDDRNLREHDSISETPNQRVHGQSKITDRWYNRDEEKKSSPVPRLIVNDSVSELVKQHAAQTPFGQKRGSGRWNVPDRSSSQNSDGPAMKNSEISPEATTGDKFNGDTTGHAEEQLDNNDSVAVDEFGNTNEPGLDSASSDANAKHEALRAIEESRLDESASCVDVSFTSPSDIIEAWSQQAAPANSGSSTRRSLLPPPKFRSARSEPGTNLEKDSTLTSSFTIIDAWSKKAAPQNADSPVAANVHEPDMSVREPQGPPASSEAETQPTSDTSGLSTQSSAFGPWKNSTTSQSTPERKPSGVNRTRKNFMLLGRKHAAKRSPQKADTAASTNGEKSVKSSSAVIVEESSRTESKTADLEESFVSIDSVEKPLTEARKGSVNEPPSSANLSERKGSPATTETNLLAARERKSFLHPPSTRSKDPSARQETSGSVIAKSESYSLSEDFEARPKDTAPGSRLKKSPQLHASQRNSKSNTSLLPHLSRLPLPSISSPATLSGNNTGSSPTTPTRKLSNEKKRLQSQRQRLSKKVEGVAARDGAKVGSSDQEACSGQDSKSSQSLASEDHGTLSLLLDLPRVDSTLKHSQLESEESHGVQTNGAIISSDQGNALRDPQSNDSVFSRASDTDDAFAGLRSTGSNVSSSSLAGRAEKVLQKRRRKSNIPQKNIATENEDKIREQKAVTHESDHDAFLQKAGSSKSAGEDVMNDLFAGDGRPRLSTRYNTSSRFVEDNNGSGGGKKQFLKLTISRSTDSGESSHFSSLDAMTTDSESRSAFEKSESDTSRAKASRRTRRNKNSRKAPNHRSLDPTIESTPSGCESVASVKDVTSDWVPASFDINKLASAVDEKMTALRDYVGGTKKSKPPLKIPVCGKLNSLDVEDVAIEVEYVEEDEEDYSNSDDEDPQEMIAAEFSAPVDDKKSEDDYATAFTDMAVRHSGYV